MTSEREIALDVKQILKEGFDVFLNDVVPLVVAGLICVLLSTVTLGVLGGPLLAGMWRMLLMRQREGKTPEIGDVFYFERFGTFVGAFYAMAVLIGIGMALFAVPGIFLSTIWLYVFPVLLDGETRLTDAMLKSKAMVERSGLGPHFGLVLLLTLIVAVLVIPTNGFAAAICTPFPLACAAVAYLTVQHSVDDLGIKDDHPTPPESSGESVHT